MGILRRTVQEKKDSWEEHLSSAVLAMNTSPHSKLGLSPFQIIFGRRCRMPSDLPSYEPPMLNQDTSEILSDIAQRIEGYEQKVKEIRSADKRSMKNRYDSKNKTKSITYNVGDSVLVKEMGLSKKKYPKFAPKFTGPYKITEVIGPVTYRIDTKRKKNMKDCVHVDRLKRWTDHIVETDEIPLVIQSSDNGTMEDQWEITNHRRTRRILMYFLRKRKRAV